MQVKQNSKDEIFFPVNILEKKRKKKKEREEGYTWVIQAQ